MNALRSTSLQHFRPQISKTSANHSIQPALFIHFNRKAVKNTALMVLLVLFYHTPVLPLLDAIDFRDPVCVYPT